MEIVKKSDNLYKNYLNKKWYEILFLKLKKFKNIKWNEVLYKDLDSWWLNILLERSNIEKNPLMYPNLGLWHNYFNYYDDLLIPFDWRFSELFSDWQYYIWYKIIPYFDKYLSYRFFFFDKNKDFIFCKHSNWEFYDINYLNVYEIFWQNVLSFKCDWEKLVVMLKCNWDFFFMLNFFNKMFINKVGSWFFNCEFFLLWGNIEIWDDWWSYIQQDLNFYKLKVYKWEKIKNFENRLDLINYLKGFKYSKDSYKISFKLMILFNDLIQYSNIFCESDKNKLNLFLLDFKKNNKYFNDNLDYISSLKFKMLLKRIYVWKNYILKLLENDEALENFYMSLFFINEKVFKQFLKNKMSIEELKILLKFYLKVYFLKNFNDDKIKIRFLKDLELILMKIFKNIGLNNIQNFNVSMKKKILKLLQDWLWKKMFFFFKVKYNLNFNNINRFTDFCEVIETIRKPCLFFRALDPVWPLFISCLFTSNLNWFKYHCYWLRPNMRGFIINYKDKIGSSKIMYKIYKTEKKLEKGHLKLWEGLLYKQGKKMKWWDNDWSFYQKRKKEYSWISDLLLNKNFLKLNKLGFNLLKLKNKKDEIFKSKLLEYNNYKSIYFNKKKKKLNKIWIGNIYKNLYNYKIYKNSPYINFNMQYNTGEVLYFILDFVRKVGNNNISEFKNEEYLNLLFNFHNNFSYKIPFYKNITYDEQDKNFVFTFLNNKLLSKKRNLGMAYSLGFLNKSMYVDLVKNCGLLYRRKNKYNYVNELKSKDYSLYKYWKKKKKIFYLKNLRKYLDLEYNKKYSKYGNMNEYNFKNDLNLIKKKEKMQYLLSNYSKLNKRKNMYNVNYLDIVWKNNKFLFDKGWSKNFLVSLLLYNNNNNLLKKDWEDLVVKGLKFQNKELLIKLLGKFLIELNWLNKKGNKIDWSKFLFKFFNILNILDINDKKILLKNLGMDWMDIRKYNYIINNNNDLLLNLRNLDRSNIMVYKLAKRKKINALKDFSNLSWKFLLLKKNKQLWKKKLINKLIYNNIKLNKNNLDWNNMSIFLKSKLNRSFLNFGNIINPYSRWLLLNSKYNYIKDKNVKLNIQYREPFINLYNMKKKK